MIYLDHNATTSVRPDVLMELTPYLQSNWGNPSSLYAFGAKLRSALERAREHVARLINAQPGEIVFTSGATESNNTVLRAALIADPSKKHLITTAVEHPSVNNMANWWESQGYPITCLGVDRDGRIDLKELKKAIRPDTALVSIIWANNETGVISPIEEAAALCRDLGVPIHTDAVQAIGKIAIDIAETPVDYLSLTGHKIHAPKGIGALFIRRKARFTPLLIGGHQEKGRRAGTENVAFIVALGAAARLAAENIANWPRVAQLRDKLERTILSTVSGARINGQQTQRICNTTNISFDGIQSAALLMLLDREGIQASSGSACLADTDEPSHVLKAMGCNDQEASSAIRFSLGLENTQDDIENVLRVFPSLVDSLRSFANQRDQRV